jgi:hypothetical protein
MIYEDFYFVLKFQKNVTIILWGARKIENSRCGKSIVRVAVTKNMYEFLV